MNENSYVINDNKKYCKNIALLINFARNIIFNPLCPDEAFCVQNNDTTDVFFFF